MADFSTSDHGLNKAQLGGPFKRIDSGDNIVSGEFYAVVDKSDGATFLTGSTCKDGDNPGDGDPVGISFGEFTNVKVSSLVWAYYFPQ